MTRLHLITAGTIVSAIVAVAGLTCSDDTEARLTGAPRLAAVVATAACDSSHYKLSRQWNDTLHAYAKNKSADRRAKKADSMWTKIELAYLAQQCAVTPPPDTTPTPPDTTPPPQPEPPPTGPLAVVPGLVGFGTTTPAGRGGTVCRVTNLNDSGTGSLRGCVSGTGARVVVFETSGAIPLTSKLVITNPFLTIAGETAPPPGILIRNWGLSIRTHDVLVHHLRVRAGRQSLTADGNTDDIEVLGPSYNVVVDHVSTEWAPDENVSTWFGSAHDITFSNVIAAENVAQEAGAVLIGDSTRNIAMIQMLIAHNEDRNPYCEGYVTCVLVNSVIYNWGGNNAAYTADPSGRGPSQVSFVGNVFLRGPSTNPGNKPIQFYGTSKPGSKMYVADNSESSINGGAVPSDPWTLVYNQFGSSGVATTPPVWPSGLTAKPNSQVKNLVLTSAGAYPAFRDAVDARIVADVQNGTGSTISHESQVGGFQPIAVNTRTLVLPADPNGIGASGYTKLEEWLQGYAKTVEGR